LWLDDFKLEKIAQSSKLKAQSKPQAMQNRITSIKTSFKAEGSMLKDDRDERSMLNAQSDAQIRLGHRLTQINTD
jgi:hypothetical protein